MKPNKRNFVLPQRTEIRSRNRHLQTNKSIENWFRISLLRPVADFLKVVLPFSCVAPSIGCDFEVRTHLYRCRGFGGRRQRDLRWIYVCRRKMLTPSSAGNCLMEEGNRQTTGKLQVKRSKVTRRRYVPFGLPSHLLTTPPHWSRTTLLVEVDTSWGKEGRGG